MAVKIVNLESGRPTIEVAKMRLLAEITTAKASGNRIIKVIHGYGSSGSGGGIKKEVQRILSQKKSSGAIRDFVKGEDFSPFTENSRRVLSIAPALRKDSDYGRCNDGITIVIV